jgi:hypothetical protein
VSNKGRWEGEGGLRLSVSQATHSPDDKKVVKLPRWSSRSADSHAYHRPPSLPTTKTTNSPPTSSYCHPSVSLSPSSHSYRNPHLFLDFTKNSTNKKSAPFSILSLCSVYFTFCFFSIQSLTYSLDITLRGRIPAVRDILFLIPFSTNHLRKITLKEQFSGSSGIRKFLFTNRYDEPIHVKQKVKTSNISAHAVLRGSKNP